MKILLFGADGQLGRELRRSLSIHGQVVPLNRAKVDLVDPSAIRSAIRAHAPDLIVNAAAYTAVDLAESQPELAAAVNRDAVATMAEQAQLMGAYLIHYSTDYVFSGESAHPYTPDDTPDPRNVYGTTKWQGEQALLASGCQGVIFRTSWVYAAGGNNFAHTMLRLGQERSELSVVSDQVGAPTSAELIADVTAIAVNRVLSDPWAPGVYHLTAGGQTSWHGFATLLIEQAAKMGLPTRVDPSAIHAIGAKDFPTQAFRPANSAMSNAKLEALLNITMPDWEVHASRFVEQIARVKGLGKA